HVRFVSSVPQPWNLAFAAARYASTKDAGPAEQPSAVKIEVLHHRDHGRNADAMIAATKRTLARYTPILGAYPFDRITIAETPHLLPNGDAVSGNLLLTHERQAWLHDIAASAFDWVSFNVSSKLIEGWLDA